ncbi:hypothetical protein [Rhodoferax sp.]|uniref:hypothetical protein n=1 Tax=Rhodoferax sp. TaxID=50421 RepID=UPI00374CBDA0
MHASQSLRHTHPSAAPTSTARPSRLLHWGQVLAGGLAVCLLLSACGGDDNNGSDGKAREVRCAR